MGVFSNDQIRVFLSVVDCGSFSGAARQLRRSQSAVSYAISNLEAQLQVDIFDREGNLPKLTAAGTALLPDARKVTYNLDTLRARADSFARGVEAELPIAVDAFCPLNAVAERLRILGPLFPMVTLSVHLELVGVAVDMVVDGRCALGIISHPMSTRKGLDQSPSALSFEFSAYVAAGHPLAQAPARVETERLASYVQLLLAKGSGLSLGQDLAIFSPRTCRSNDLRAQHALLLAGIGWGFMPAHLVADDLAAGRLVRLDLAPWPRGGTAEVPLMIVRHADAALGPAASWLLRHLTEVI